MALTKSQAEAYYNRFGKLQDTQSFYEDSAVDEMIAHADFQSATRVFELGCGTGRLALRLLSDQLRPLATYLGVDLSRTMVELATSRLASFSDRAQVTQSDGSIRFPAADRSIDRVVSTYVLDLLSESDMKQAVAESRRVLSASGRLCLVSLTFGTGPVSRLVSTVWERIFRWRATMVGGCRPIHLETILGDDQWTIEFQNVVTKWGVPSEVLIARPTDRS